MVRNSLRFEYHGRIRRLWLLIYKTIYTATNAEVAKESLSAFRIKWDGKLYPTIADSWERNWEGLMLSTFYRIQTILERRFTRPMELNRAESVVA